MDENDTMANGEAPMPDAAMMDNIDDLFGEADGLGSEALGVPLPSAPLPPSLMLRIMEMQNRGCCTKVAWSNTGSIAYITDRGQNIAFRALIRNQKSGQWSLAEESKTPISAPEGTAWEHIQFSGIGIDLAAVDHRGTVHIHTLVGALGKMPLAPSNIDATENGGRPEFDAVVGMHWLAVFPTEFKVPYISPAHKIGDKWATDMRNRDLNEPCVHHVVDGRHALLHVSREAKLTLMYQNEMALWHATSTKLENIFSSNEMLSHAAMGEEGDHLLLITHDLARRFKLYKITIKWNPTQQTRQAGQPAYTVVAPEFDIVHLTAIEYVAAQQADTAKLSHLRLIPAIPNVAADATSPSFPTVLAVFTRASLAENPNQQHQEAFSVIARWHVELTVSTLHESFLKLKKNATAPTQSAVTVLRRQEDVMTNKLVISVEPHYYGTILALSASDGSIEFRDRVTMASIEPYGDTSTVSSLAQAGFEHMMAEHHADIAMSADGSALAMVKSDGSLTYKLISLRYSWQPLEDGISDTRGLIEAAVVCLSRQHSILLSQSTANDEILALIPHDLSTELRTIFVREIIRMTNRNLDISMHDTNRQQMLAIKEPLLRFALSAQLVIGVKAGTMERTWASKFAFAFLNMRLVCTGVVQLVSRPDLNMRADFLHSMRGLVKWACDTLVYVVDNLVAVKRFMSSKPGISPQQAFSDFIAEKDNPALNMILCTFTRAYIRFLASCLPKYLQSVQRVLSTARSLAERQQLEETFQYGASLPFRFSAFEPFITEVDTSIRNAYAAGSIPPERRAEIELTTMTEPAIPAELLPAVQNMMDNALPRFMENMDLAALYFKDTNWIGIEPAPGWRYDVIRKLPLTDEMKLRVCRRCGAMMEDVTPDRAREMPGWLGHAQRHCVCGNYWILE